MGNCANAPMIQVNDDNFEDLSYETTTTILEALARGERPKPGTQIDRQFSAPVGGPTTLKELMACRTLHSRSSRAERIRTVWLRSENSRVRSEGAITCVSRGSP